MTEGRPKTNTPAAATGARASAGRARRGVARHGRLRRHPWGTVGKVTASIAAVALASAMGIGVVAAVNLESDVPPPVHLVGQTPGPIPDIGALEGGMNLLIAATDSRTGQGTTYGTTDDSSGIGLNDVTMLLHLSQDHSHAEVISFPRDLMIPFPQCPDGQGGWNSAMSKAQLNSSLSDGGLPCTVLVIKELTGLDIQAAGLVKFTGVVAMSNAVGGVPVCVGGEGIHDPDTDLDLAPGTHTLQGVQAAQFLRTRHGVSGGSDLARISNQQVFLSSLVRTIMSRGTLTDPVKVWGLAKSARTNITFSDNLNNLTTLYQVALAVRGLDFGKITFVQYPVFDDPDDNNRVVPDDESAQTLMDAIKTDRPLTITAGTGSGSVAPTATPQPSASASTPPSSTAPAPSSTAVELGENVHGQSAAVQTCSNGSG